jgi:predicted nucleotidyltransferase
VASVELEGDDHRQIEDIIAALNEVLGRELIGAYLHGSAVLGGLRAQSDIDVLAVAVRRLTAREKQHLLARFLAISGPDPAHGPPRPIELTVVVESAIKPWRYPPEMDFQYGEWLRERFESGDIKLSGSRVDPDVTVLVKMALLGDAPLAGPQPSQVFDPVPSEDFVAALVAGVEPLLANIDSDTGNVVLTLARIWCGVRTDAVLSKDAAAEWALQYVTTEQRVVLARARDIYVGTSTEGWGDLRDRVRPFARAIVTEIENAAVTRR